LISIFHLRLLAIKHHNDYWKNKPCLFQVVRHLVSLRPAMDRTMEGCEPTLRSKYQNMVNQVLNHLFPIHQIMFFNRSLNMYILTSANYNKTME